jgi:hypothetical protein
MISMTNNMTSNFEPRNNRPLLDLLGTYLYMFLAYHPLHSLTKTLTLSWLGILSCVPHMPSSLHARLFFTCFFSCLCIYLTFVASSTCAFASHVMFFPQKWSAPNT